jgi:aldehyde oxidoreductase
MIVAFTVNGAPARVEAEATDRLSDVLREDLSLIGTKIGCNAGDCGACTVLINGEMACACLTAMAQVAGAAVTTVEGLCADETLNQLQQSFLAHGAAQCGICTPGMLMAATDLLSKQSKPTHQQVQDALGGVLCRCTGYAKIIDAVMSAAVPQKSARAEAGRAIGKAIPRVDGVPKVLGVDYFGADKLPVDAVAVRLLRSPYHAASFTFGDLKRFVASNPGITAVFTATDIPGRNVFGVIPAFADQPALAEGVSKFRGEAIAAIAGEPEAIRKLDITALPVTFEPLQAVTSPADAEMGSAPQLHPSKPGNILVRGYVERGDIETGFREAACTVEARYTTPFIEHAYIEPEAGYAIRDGDRLTIFGCTQAPHMDKEAIADILGLNHDQVRVVPSACGGGFGSKLDLSFQPFIALAAWKLNRPAYIVYSRQESMQSTTKRHPSDITIRAACDATGKISAVDFDGVFNTGAYSSWGPTVANRVPIHASGPYFTPNYRARSRAVLTNCVPAGAFRGFGVPQTLIALESIYDVLADKAGIDRLEFRLRNALRNGEPTVTGQVFASGVGISECLAALKPRWHKAGVDAMNFNGTSERYRKGVGLATCWYGCGNTSLPNPSTVRIGITHNGHIMLHQGATDIGQGANTVIAQITADAFGVSLENISLIGPDTDLTPDCGKTSASRQTFVTGSAAKKAAETLRRKLSLMANVANTAAIELRGAVLTLTDGHNRVAIDLAAQPKDAHGYAISAEETYDPQTTPLDTKGQGAPYAVYGYGAQLVELTVDTALGKVKLDHITAAHDVGRAINPMLVEGQIEGGIAQGIGMALMEDYIPGRTENLHDYLIPTVGDMPEITSIIIEVEDPTGPFGAKGLGEHVLIPTAPAILSAIRDATGAVIHHLPATPDKVLSAIKALKQ